MRGGAGEADARERGQREERAVERAHVLREAALHAVAGHVADEARITVRQRAGLGEHAVRARLLEVGDEVADVVQLHHMLVERIMADHRKAVRRPEALHRRAVGNGVLAAERHREHDARRVGVVLRIMRGNRVLPLPAAPGAGGRRQPLPVEALRKDLGRRDGLLAGEARGGVRHDAAAFEHLARLSRIAGEEEYGVFAYHIRLAQDVAEGFEKRAAFQMPPGDIVVVERLVGDELLARGGFRQLPLLAEETEAAVGEAHGHAAVAGADPRAEELGFLPLVGDRDLEDLAQVFNRVGIGDVGVALFAPVDVRVVVAPVRPLGELMERLAALLRSERELAADAAAIFVHGQDVETMLAGALDELAPEAGTGGLVDPVVAAEFRRVPALVVAELQQVARKRVDAEELREAHLRLEPVRRLVFVERRILVVECNAVGHLLAPEEVASRQSLRRALERQRELFVRRRFVERHAADGEAGGGGVVLMAQMREHDPEAVLRRLVARAGLGEVREARVQLEDTRPRLPCAGKRIVDGFRVAVDVGHLERVPERVAGVETAARLVAGVPDDHAARRVLGILDGQHVGHTGLEPLAGADSHGDVPVGRAGTAGQRQGRAAEDLGADALVGGGTDEDLAARIDGAAEVDFIDFTKGTQVDGRARRSRDRSLHSRRDKKRGECDVREVFPFHDTLRSKVSRVDARPLRRACCLLIRFD